MRESVCDSSGRVIGQMTASVRTRQFGKFGDNSRRTKLITTILFILTGLLVVSAMTSAVVNVQKIATAVSPEIEARLLSTLMGVISETIRVALRYLNALFSWLPK